VKTATGTTQDGREYSVDVPDEWTPQQVADVVSRAPKQTEAQQTSIDAPLPSHGAEERRPMGHAPTEYEQAIAREYYHQDKGIDYNQTLPFNIGRQLAGMDTVNERESYLEKTFGKDNVTVDHAGRFVIKPEGFKQANLPVPTQPVWANVGTTSDVAAHPLSVGGMILLPLLVPEEIPLAAGARILAAGAGATGGKAVEETGKVLQGNFKQTNEELARSMRKEFKTGVEGQIGGEVLGKVLKGGVYPFKTQENVSAFREAMDRGYIPRMGQGISSPVLERHQAKWQALFGSGASKNAEQFATDAERYMRKFLKPAEATRAKNDLLDMVASKASTAEEGERLILGARNQMKRLVEDTAQSRQVADQFLDRRLKNVETNLGSSNPELYETAQQQLKTAHRQFQDEASNQYAAFDQIAERGVVGKQAAPKNNFENEWQISGKGTPGVDYRASMKNLKDQVIEIYRIDPYVKAKGSLNWVLDQPSKTTLKELQNIRRTFGEQADVNGLIGDVPSHYAGKLYKAADKTFDDVMEGISGNPAMAHAVGALKNADAFYKQGIKKFKPLILQRIMREAGTTGSIQEPDKLIDEIFQPKMTTRLAHVMSRVDDKTKAQIGRSALDKIVTDSSKVGKSGMETDSKLFYQNVMKYGKTLDVAIGKKNADIVRSVAKRGAALDTHIDLSALQSMKPEGLNVGVIREAVEKEARLTSYLKDNYLSALADGSVPPEKVADFILKDSTRAKQAMEFYGTNSSQANEIRYSLAKRIFGAGIEAGDKPSVAKLSGQSLLSEYDKVGKKTIEAVVGKPLADDWYRFGKVIQFVTPKPIGSGLAAPSEALSAWHSLKHLIGFGQSIVMNKIAYSKPFLEFLITGFSGKSKTFGTALANMGTIATKIRMQHANDTPDAQDEAVLVELKRNYPGLFQ